MEVDDTRPLFVAIEDHRDDGHILYEIRVTHGVLGDSHVVERRYSEFANLVAHVQGACGLALPLPPKRMFGNKDLKFIHERKEALDNLLQRVIKHPILIHDPEVIRFLDNGNIPADLQAEQHRALQMFFRSTSAWRLTMLIPSTGWRMRKAFCEVQSQGYTSHDTSGVTIMAWTPIGERPHIEPAALNSALKYIAGITHPFIAPAVLGCLHEANGAQNAIVMRPEALKGSLRDVICRLKSNKGTFSSKYTALKAKGLPDKTIRLYGRQILEGLRFLHEKGLPYGHLHTGNVLVINDHLCQLSDVENGVLGINALYDGFVTQQKKINTLERRDVYCFGRVLFEMITGRPLGSSLIDNVNPSSFGSDVLEQLLTPHGIRSLPTVSQLLNDPFFKDIPLGQVDKGSFKMSARVKEALLASKDSAFTAMRTAQASLEQLKRTDEQARDAEKRRKQRERERSRQVKTSSSAAVGGFSATIASPMTSPPSTKPPSPTPQPAPSAPPPPSMDAAPAISPPPAPTPAPPAAGEPRGALLGSISSFSKDGLKKAETNDRSGPDL
eukprot:m.82514 g.82514  ORF g.82514 m.82514 type:complete len:555 (+) comp14617_c0_seq3:181-1845(+)